MRIIIIFFSFLILIGISIKLNASDTLVLTKENQQYFDYVIDHRYTERFIDSSGDHFSINEVTAPAFEKKFIRKDKQDHYDPLKGYTYWIKTTITNRSAKGLKWLFIQGDPAIGHIEFYAPNEKKNNQYYLIGEGGVASPFHVRQYDMISLAFDLPLDSGQTKTFYLKAKSKNNFSFKMIVHESKFSMNYFLSEYYFIGFYYGMLILMAIYNLVIYFSIRDRVYIYYVLYVLATCLINATTKHLSSFCGPIPQ
jgi:two-component system, sensor histidine kinase LadS